MKQTDSPLKWGDVNLYTNEFTDVAQVTAFDTGLYGLQLSSTNIQSPEFTLEGAAPKCWKKEDSGIVLYNFQTSFFTI